jgi:hypothetical protein
MTHSGQESVAISVYTDQLEYRRGKIVQTVGSCEFVKQEQHDSQEESLKVALVGKDILNDSTHTMTRASLR